MPKTQDAAPAPPPAGTPFECISPIEHNGRRIEIGETVSVPDEMTDEIAAVLVTCGALRA